MKKLITFYGTLFFAITIITSCGGKTTAECKNDVSAYEFGREMHFYAELAGDISLTKAIDGYVSGLGVNPPYDADNDCVKRGFSDAEDNKESPYNKEGKSWNSF